VDKIAQRNQFQISFEVEFLSPSYCELLARTRFINYMYTRSLGFANLAHKEYKNKSSQTISKSLAKTRILSCRAKVTNLEVYLPKIIVYCCGHKRMPALYNGVNLHGCFFNHFTIQTILLDAVLRHHEQESCFLL
jgi:hypothetical protein